ncbi:MAG: hypothetical protein LLG40_06400, partial [Deltaproteobacteria bacterium]|nr:hypothetical protein [Deltaproteobacteria bacterium]
LLDRGEGCFLKTGTMLPVFLFEIPLECSDISSQRGAREGEFGNSPSLHVGGGAARKRQVTRVSKAFQRDLKSYLGRRLNYYFIKAWNRTVAL